MNSKDITAVLVTNVVFVAVLVSATLINSPFLLIGAVAVMIFVVGSVMFFLSRKGEVTPAVLAIARVLRY